MPSAPAAKGVATRGSSSLDAVNRLAQLPSSRCLRTSSVARTSAQAILRPSHSISAIPRPRKAWATDHA